MGIRRGWRWRQRKKKTRAPIIVERPKSKAQTSCAYIDEGKHWFVAYVRPMSEKSVARKLEAAAPIITYLPLVSFSIERRMRGRSHTFDVERALFASYLFVGMRSPERHFAAVKQMDGVIDLLSDEKQEPVEIPARLLRGIERDLAGPMPVKTGLSVGDSVRISDGPLASFFAVVEEFLSEKHVRALVTLFGRQTLAELQVSQLEAA